MDKSLIKRELGCIPFMEWVGHPWLRGSDRYGSPLHVPSIRLGLTVVSLSESHKQR